MNRKKSVQKVSNLFCGLLGLFLVTVLTVLDQMTKYLADSHLRGQESLVLIPGVLELRYLENRGIAWGMFQGKLSFFLFFTVFFFVVMGYFYFRLPKTSYYTPLLIVLIGMTAGALGNFWDRLIRGYVIDFIYLSLFHFPIFNFADICVVCSGILLVLLILFKYEDSDFEFLIPRKKGRN